MTTSHDTLRILDIVPGTSVDGPGLRTSIYVAGCKHQCPGCHNPESWDINGGNLMTVSRIIEVVEDNGFNVTLSGGDPLYQPEAVATLCDELKKRGYNIWLYTGYHFEDIVLQPQMLRVLRLIDVLVDGPYVDSERDLTLHFRGSRNQRLIDVRRSLAEGCVVLFEQL